MKLTTRERFLIIICICVLCMTILYQFAFIPVFNRWADLGQALENAQAELFLLQDIAKDKDVYADRLKKACELYESMQIRFYTAGTAGSATLELLDSIHSRSEQCGLTVLSKEALKEYAWDSLTVISVKFTLAGDIAKLSRLLFELENDEKIHTVSSFSVIQTSGGLNIYISVSSLYLEGAGDLR